PSYARSWWIDKKLFQLERRAIFSKQWLYATHASRFSKPGDYRTFDIAGFSIIVILGKDKVLRAFHNVCRHRAYAVTKKECGSSIVLGCRYHGWSYDTKGKLTKAPEFDKVPEFDKQSNGLWEVATSVLDGMVFINLQAGSVVDFDFTTSTRRLIRDLKARTFRTEWKIEVKSNWKLVVELLQDKPIVEAELRWYQSVLAWLTPHDETEIISEGAFIKRLSSKLIMTIRVLPQTGSNSVVECVVYEAHSWRKSYHETAIEGYERAMRSEIQRIESKQVELLKGNYISTNQDLFSDMIQKHLAAERSLGKEIHPAAQKGALTNEGQDDDEMCKEIDLEHSSISACTSSAMGDLDW
ncbi:Rieske [2Fe-2S] iron-sulfur domain-containing protein, partial [Calycina marina]